MTGSKTFFQGGIHPADVKILTRDKPIRNAHVPSIAVVPMLQHTGKPAECIVKVNDVLKEGMLIGRASGFISSNIYSPIPGKVIEIRDTVLSNSARCQAVVIELQGEFHLSGKEEKIAAWNHLSPKQLLDKILAMGVVGLGGAAFPTHVKYGLPLNTVPDAFIVNGAECEPYLTADHRLLLEKAGEILTGIEIVEKILKPNQVFIGIETNKIAAIRRISKLAKERYPNYRVVPLKVKYPQGDEKLIVKSILKKEVPSGGLPIDIGAVVSNVSTIFSIYEAVVLDKPLIERIITVTGSIVKNPSNLKVRTGTKIGELIEECGGFTEPPAKIIAGGPMMGFSICDLDIPVTKAVTGIVALSKKEVNNIKQTNCIQCGRCIRSCPMGLNPTALFKWIDHNEYRSALDNGLLNCRECGCCGFACPARLPLVQAIQVGKKLGQSKGN